MATFEYKVRPNDTLQLGDSTNTVSIPGAMTTDGALTVTSTFKATGVIAKSVEKVTTTGTSDVADPDVYSTLITSGGAHTVTLADGSISGQVKKICISDVTAGTITITPANFADGTSMTMAEVHDSVELIWDGINWNISFAAGVAIV